MQQEGFSGDSNSIETGDKEEKDEAETGADPNNVSVQEDRDAVTGRLIRSIALKGSIPHGETVIYDEKGSIACKLKYEEGILSGPAEFYSNGSPLMFCTFIDGKQEGEATFFNNGSKSAKAFFKNGVFEGDFTSYDPDGNVIRVAEYVGGKQHGLCQSFYPDGTLLEQSTYKNGKLDGEFARCFPNGNVMELSNYKDGKPYGYIDKYDMNGNLLSRTEVQ